MDQSAIDDLFERNADMRLLEFRHSDPGKPLAAAKAAAATFSAESIVAAPAATPLVDTAALRVAISAAPKQGVIPGAMVGVAIDVFNDGNAPAPESKLLVSLPVDSEFRSGSLRVDGREVTAPEQLFGQGLPMARLPGGTSAKVTFQLVVSAGVNALYLQPRLQAEGVPVVGTPGVTVKRSLSAFTTAPERPFYELDDEEEAVERAASPGAPPELPPVPAPAAPPARPVAMAEPVPVEPLAPKDAASAAPDGPPAPPPPSLPETPAPAPRAPAPRLPLVPVQAAEERMARFRTLGPSDVALLERLFAADVPGLIAHFVLISSIACNEPPAGEDASGFGAFLRRDIELLGRALVHSRMGKAPQYRVAQADLDPLALSWEAGAPQTFPPPRRLRRDLRKPEWTAIRGLTQPSERDATLRIRIALLALSAATVEGVERRRADECEAALNAYRSSALAWLVPLCVASAGTGAFVLPAPAAAVDAAGRKLVAAIKTSLA